MTSLPDTVRLEATDVTFLSLGDETAFFTWLKSLPFVAHVDGHHKLLHIDIATSLLDEEGLRELLALFQRYRLPLNQLAALDADEFALWFRNPRADWFRGVFGSDAAPALRAR
ncbi:hypothetical protein [Tahibacter amnicola]|uniref:Uncharacterized protein n=1 Tax=Tahibacter amnicola TaxID=2976241 RepID=A0ABY6B9S6_9GAMM|nr:hypothetical protein [Tahibacter amnicola]UXI66429.1 hypothetical protein N4264_16955 [Tahibacter amnicola]